MISSLTWLQTHHHFCFHHRQHFVALHTRYLYWLLLNGKSVTMFSFEGDFRRTPKVSLGGASRKVSFPFDMHHYIWHLSTMIITWKLTILYCCNMYQLLYHLDIGSILLCLTRFCSGGKSIPSSSNTRRKKEKRGEHQPLGYFTDVYSVLLWKEDQKVKLSSKKKIGLTFVI